MFFFYFCLVLSRFTASTERNQERWSFTRRGELSFNCCASRLTKVREKNRHARILPPASRVPTFSLARYPPSLPSSSFMSFNLSNVGEFLWSWWGDDMRDYMDGWVTPPTWGPPPLCKQALNVMSHGTIRNDDFKRNAAVATLLRPCFSWLQHCFNIVLR